MLGRGAEFLVNSQQLPENQWIGTKVEMNLQSKKTKENSPDGCSLYRTLFIRFLG